MRFLLLGLIACSAVAQTSSEEPAFITQARAALDRAGRMINDYGDTRRYAADNQKLPPPAPGEQRVVFMGDSITDAWGRNNNGSSFFPGKPYVNRGISGQVTPQMLLRFHQDVIELKPRAVVILAGTNDIGGNIGPMTLDAIEQYLTAMTELARGNNIKVILASVLPVCDYHKPQIAQRPPEKILALNQWIKDYSARNGLVYLDYFSSMVDDKGFFRAELTYDGLHPNAAGYEVMGPLAEKSIAAALGK